MASHRDRAATEPAVEPAPPISAWRRAISSFRGFTIASGLALLFTVLVVLITANLIRAARAPEPLLGQTVVYPTSGHIPDGSLGPNPGLTPAGGPHYSGTTAPGIYDHPVGEGNTIHSLEHGIVWITYHPDQISDAELDTLEGIAADFDHDTILSPRLENSFPVIIVSWERRLTQTHLHEQHLRDFVETNRNRSPEPGVR